MSTALATRRPNPSEEGYILVAVIFMLALLMIALTVAAPRMKKAIQRDQELETLHRGKQYARGVKLYFKKFGTYPANIDALVNTNQIRFIRKKYTDPTTGKEEWKPVRYGMNKAPTAMGFFGQPIGGAGAGGGLCGNAIPSSTGSGSTSTIGAGSSSFPSSSGFGSNPANSNCPPADGSSSAGTPGATGATGATGDNSAGTTPPTDPNAGAGTVASGTTSAFGSPTGQSFGGAGIIGFSPNSPKPSLYVYKKKKHYNEWEFVYDPRAEQMMMQGGMGAMGGAGLNGNGSGTNGIGGNGLGGSSGGGIGGGSNSGIGTQQPPQQAQPQQ